MKTKKAILVFLLIVLSGSFADFTFSQATAPVALRWNLSMAEIAAWPKCTTTAPAACITDFAVRVFSAPTVPGPLQSIAYTPAVMCSASIVTNCADAAGYRASVLLSQLGPLPPTSPIRFGVIARGVDQSGAVAQSPEIILDLQVTRPPAVSNLAVAQTTTGATIKGAGSVAAPPNPVITLFAFGSITSTSATGTWTTDLNADSQIKCGTVTGVYTNYYPSSPDPAMVTSHSQVVSPLLPGTQYFCRAISQGATGPPVESNELNFTTTTPPSTGPPDYNAANYTTGVYSETGNNWNSAWFASNVTFTEPIFGTALVGLTRALACPSAGFDQVLVPDNSGINIFNSDSSRVIVRSLSASSSNLWIPMNFDATTRQFSRIAGNGTNCNGSGMGLDLQGSGKFGSGEPTFSYLASPNDRAYSTKSGSANIIEQYTFDETVTAGPNTISCTGTACTSTAHGASTNNYVRLVMGEIRRITATPTGDTLTIVSAFTADPAASAWNKVVVGAGAVFADLKTITAADCDTAFGSASGSLQVSADDDVFLIAGAGAGQDNFTHVVAYSRTRGCRILETTTGTVSNGVGATWSGATGTVTGTVRGKIHSVQISKDGLHALITIAGCTADCTNPGRVAWEINSLNLTHAHNNPTELGGGHSVACYSGTANGPNRSDMTETYWRTFASFLVPYRRAATVPTTLSGYFGEHYQSCNHSRSVGTANMPFLETFYRVTNLGTTISQRRFDNEVLMVWGGDGAVAEKVARFSKTCASVSNTFSAAAPRAISSQDGRFAAFATNGSNCGLAGQPWMFTVVRLD